MVMEGQERSIRSVQQSDAFLSNDDKINGRRASARDSKELAHGFPSHSGSPTDRIYISNLKSDNKKSCTCR